MRRHSVWSERLGVFKVPFAISGKKPDIGCRSVKGMGIGDCPQEEAIQATENPNSESEVIIIEGVGVK
jgi:hypothetical protein